MNLQTYNIFLNSDIHTNKLTNLYKNKIMKSLIITLISVALVSNCNNTEETAEEPEVQITPQEFSVGGFPQKWQLYQMTGQVADAEPITGTNMSWQETYILNDDNTFTKKREHGGQVIESKGTYAFSNTAEGISVIMKHNLPTKIIGNCSGDKNEELTYNKLEKSLTSNWWACDGPGLFYKKVN